MINRVPRGAACASCFDPVPDAPHGLNQLMRAVPVLLPQITDIELDIVSVAEAVVATNLFEDSIARTHMDGMHHQHPQKTALAGANLARPDLAADLRGP